MNEKIEALKSSFDSELKKIANMVDLEALRVNYLGRKGKVTDALKGMGSLTDEQKKTVGRDVSVGEVIPEVLKDRVYYRRSGGGLTLSGGETPCPNLTSPCRRTCPAGRITRLRWCSASASRCSNRWASRWRITPRS